MVLLDKQSWDLMPEWLRPVQSQLTIRHNAWIDRIPWFVQPMLNFRIYPYADL